MKFTDKIILKYGTDKIIHFLVAGWIVSLFSNFGFVAMLISTIVIIALSIIKEKYLDESEDWNDLYAAIYGIIVTWITILCSLII